ncbi:hypothetical protein DSECCO2_355810 [anaerobic digester metagenome]
MILNGYNTSTSNYNILTWKNMIKSENSQKKKSSVFEFLIVLIFASSIVILILFLGKNLVYGFSAITTPDSSFYLQMSLNPFQRVNAPYTYRVLTPLLVYVLPLSHWTGFTIINSSGIIATGVLMYYYLKKLKFSPLISFLGLILFLFAPATIYLFYNIALVDSLSFLLFLLAFYAILIENDIIYVITLILGILNKETILLTLPVYFFYTLKNQGRTNAIKKTILMLAIASIIFISIRYYYGFTSHYSLTNAIDMIKFHINNQSMLFVSYFLTFSSLWLIALMNLNEVKNDFLKISLITLPFIFLQMLLATDVYRVLAITFPIIIPISLYIYKVKKAKLYLYFLLSILSLFAYLVWLSIGYFVYPLDIMLFMGIPLQILVSTLLLVFIFRSVFSPKSNIS